MSNVGECACGWMSDGWMGRLDHAGTEDGVVWRGGRGKGRREGSISLLCTLDPITFLSKPQQSTDDVGCCGREVQVQVHTRN